MPARARGGAAAGGKSHILITALVPGHPSVMRQEAQEGNGARHPTFGLRSELGREPRSHLSKPVNTVLGVVYSFQCRRQSALRC